MYIPAKYLLASAAALAVFAATAAAQDAAPAKVPSSSADEPMAAKLSLVKAAEFLDLAGTSWTSVKKCGTCHTNYPYLMARPALKEGPMTGHDEVRAFFEKRIEGWDTDLGKPRFDAEVIATAATLAFNDAQTTGKLHPLTRKALDRMWTLQLKNGSFDWIKCNWPPLEHDDYYGVVYAAVGVGYAPENYATGASAKEGMARLRTYLTRTAPPNLHHKAWLLWASVKHEGLLTKERREETIKELLALQRPDGGWSLPSLGYWQSFDPKHEIDRSGGSDGYGTGLIVYILRQAGLPADHAAIQKGVKWLQGNQRESGRWFTRSLNTDRYHYITNAGTAFAVLALKSCE
ncbi:MAG: terpene cyclase/mutase family protein [Planctomycetia bacterium]|nr:terpene cyclase/mutase family protein [Planctomycetia bacterium]